MLYQYGKCCNDPYIHIPKYDELFEPALAALKALGGSATVQEIYDKVCEIQNYSEDQQCVLHKKGPQTEIAYRLAWARTYLKKCGLLESRGRGLWALTDQGASLETVDRQRIKQVVKSGDQFLTSDEETGAIDQNKSGYLIVLSRMNGWKLYWRWYKGFHLMRLSGCVNGSCGSLDLRRLR